MHDRTVADRLGLPYVVRTPEAPMIVVSYGGGVNSVAVLVELHRQGRVPTAIVMADPGSEHAATEHYRDVVLPPWLSRVGFPRVTVVSRAEEGRLREGVSRHESLEEECTRIAALPSIAYGWKKCSAKYKGESQRWWVARQTWAQEEWSAGRKIQKAIGYDTDEERRVLAIFPTPWEDARFTPVYPLIQAGWDREGCEALIRDAGLPSPGKSACTYCPNNTLAEWQQLQANEPDAFARAVAMSRRALPLLTSPRSTGLMRCNPHGQRQLHTWADGLYATGFRDADPVRPEDVVSPEVEDAWNEGERREAPLAFEGRAPDAEDLADALPCECAL